MKKIVFLIILNILLSSFINIKKRNICDKNWETTFNNNENYKVFITFKSNGVYNVKIFFKEKKYLLEDSVGTWVKKRNTIIITIDNIYHIKLKIVAISKNMLVLKDEKSKTLTYKLKTF